MESLFGLYGESPDAVVSEDSAHNPYQGGLVTGPLSELLSLCRRYLDDPSARQRIAEQGFELFRQRPMVELVRCVL